MESKIIIRLDFKISFLLQRQEERHRDKVEAETNGLREKVGKEIENGGKW